MIKIGDRVKIKGNDGGADLLGTIIEGKMIGGKIAVRLDDYPTAAFGFYEDEMDVVVND